MKIEYLKFVRWSEADGVYVGYCPDLFIGGVCHGKDERKVYSTLCSLVEKEVERLSALRQDAPVPRVMVARAVSI